MIHYRWASDGAITEVERIPTSGSGTGDFSPIYGINRPNDFEGAGSVVLSPDLRFLFTTNAGENSVSSFGVGKEGRLTLVDCKRTGNDVTGKSGSADSLAYAPSSHTLYVLHCFGPDHCRLMSVGGDGKLTPRRERYSVNSETETDRVTTMATLSPDERFLMVGNIFDERPSVGPDGKPRYALANTKRPDGLVVFRVNRNGTLGPPSVHDAKGGVPFYIAFLHNRPDHFIIGLAVGNGCVMCTIDADGKIETGPLVPIDTSGGKPSELCWLAITPDDKCVFATNFGYSNVSSYRIDGDELTLLKDPACPAVPGDGTFKAFNGTISSGPSDSWMTPDGAYLYQIYGNASKLVGYAIQPDGSLNEITSAKIPYNGPQGLAGF